jgi:hypothetical protein
MFEHETKETIMEDAVTNYLKKMLDTSEAAEDRRLREIAALRLHGLATWKDSQEESAIRRRQVLRGVV